jgi:hypothetical protein
MLVFTEWEIKENCSLELPFKKNLFWIQGAMKKTVL